MQVPVIQNEDDYQKALEQLEMYVRARQESLRPAIDALTAVIGLCGARDHALEPPDPIDAVRFRREQLGWTQNQLAEQLGMESGRLSEVMTLRRPLTLPMIRRIHEVLGIPADVLIKPYFE